jgi:hypothetical protein
MNYLNPILLVSALILNTVLATNNFADGGGQLVINVIAATAMALTLIVTYK